MTEHYRTQVEQLYAALQNDSQGQRAIAAEQIRLLMKEIVLTPEHGELQIDVRGDLAGILAISLERKKPALGAGKSQFEMVAGARNEVIRRNTPRYPKPRFPSADYVIGDWLAARPTHGAHPR